jgi:hypothetical protein
MEHLRLILGDLGREGSPLKSEEPLTSDFEWDVEDSNL